MPEGGAEYARVVYGIASPPGEIPRPLYEARGYEPPFDTLPTKREGEAAQASNTGEADSGDVVTGYAAISRQLAEVRGPNDESFDDTLELTMRSPLSAAGLSGRLPSSG